MQGVLATRDGKIHTVLDIRDILTLVNDYAGCEIRSWIEEWIDEQLLEIEDAKGEAQECQEELDQLRDHQRLVLSDIYEDAAWLIKLTNEPKMKREDIRECAQRICNTLYLEL